MRGSVGRNKTIINCQVMSRASDASYIPNFKDADGSNSILQTSVYIFVWGKSKKTLGQFGYECIVVYLLALQRNVYCVAYRMAGMDPSLHQKCEAALGSLHSQSHHQGRVRSPLLLGRTS